MADVLTPLPSLSFDRVAEEYETTRPMPPVIAQRLARRCLAGVPDGGWFLDAGVGTGRVGRALAAAHPRTVGVDIGPAMLSKAGGMHRTLADLRALPFADRTFSAVLVVHVLHLIPEWDDALAELWRVVTPGGRLILGFEEREPTVTRETYLELARERGIPLDSPGGTTKAILAHVETLGGSVSHVMPEELAWSTTATVAQTLRGLELRTFSALWSVSDEDHASLLEETRNRTKLRFGSERYTEVAKIRMLLVEAIKPR